MGKVEKGSGCQDFFPPPKLPTPDIMGSPSNPPLYYPQFPPELRLFRDSQAQLRLVKGGNPWGGG